MGSLARQVDECLAVLHNLIHHYEQVAKEGIPLPPDRTLCPLCSQRRGNPSVITVSGFVFCYACVFKYVSQVSFPEAVNFDSQTVESGNLFYKLTKCVHQADILGLQAVH